MSLQDNNNLLLRIMTKEAANALPSHTPARPPYPAYSHKPILIALQPAPPGRVRPMIDRVRFVTAEELNAVATVLDFSCD